METISISKTRPGARRPVSLQGTNETEHEEIMTVQSELGRTAEDLSRLGALIQKYPAETKMIMSAVEEGRAFLPVVINLDELRDPGLN